MGTSFKKHGRVKKIGVDCIGLILGLLDELSHPNLCKIPLSNDYSLEEKTPILLNILRSCFEEITSIETPAITLFEYEGGYQHLGVAFKTNDKILAIIHADITARKVVMHSLDAVSYTHLDVYKRQVSVIL